MQSMNALSTGWHQERDSTGTKLYSRHQHNSIKWAAEGCANVPAAVPIPVPVPALCQSQDKQDQEV